MRAKGNNEIKLFLARNANLAKRTDGQTRKLLCGLAAHRIDHGHSFPGRPSAAGGSVSARIPWQHHVLEVNNSLVAVGAEVPKWMDRPEVTLSETSRRRAGERFQLFQMGIRADYDERVRGANHRLQ